MLHQNISGINIEKHSPQFHSQMGRGCKDIMHLGTIWEMERKSPGGRKAKLFSQFSRKTRKRVPCLVTKMKTSAAISFIDIDIT